MDLLRILDDKPAPSIVDAETLGVSGNTSGDYWLPTTMCLYQKQLTDQIVSLHYSDILRYFETTDYKEDVVLESMETMCKNSALVATHPFLLIDHFLPKSLITRDIPVHLSETSGKFTVLRDLFTLVQEYETNTAVVCQSGRTMDLVEALLLGNKVSIKRYDGHSARSRQKKSKRVSHPCTVHLFPSEGWDNKAYPVDKKTKRFDMFVAVDPTVDTTKDDMLSILQLGRRTRDVDPKAPIARLVAINSFDHCDLYFRKEYEKGSKEYLESVTAGVVVLRDRIGVLPPDLRPIYSQHLGYLVEWLENPSLPWPLPDVYRIKHYNSMDVERSLLSEVNYTQNDDLDSAFTQGPMKKRGRGRPQLNELKDSANNNEHDESVPSFYETKRLKNDYSKNPMKQGKGVLTGIISNDDSMGANYHLSSEILTHKLVQSMAQVYFELERQSDQIRMYTDIDAIEQRHANFYSNEDQTMKEKLNMCQGTISYNKNICEELEEDNVDHYKRNEKLEVELEEKFEVLLETFPDSKPLKELLIKNYDLKDKLEDVNKKIDSKSTEILYMQAELQKAKDSLKTSSKEIEKVIEECRKIEVDLKVKADGFEKEKDELDEDIIKINKNITDERKHNETLVQKLEELGETLQNIPIQRIRPSHPTGRRR